MGFSLEKHSRRTDARLTRQLLVNLNERIRRLIEDIRVFHTAPSKPDVRKKMSSFYTSYTRLPHVNSYISFLRYLCSALPSPSRS